VETYVYGISRAMERLGAEVHLVTIEKQKNLNYGNIHVYTIDLTAPIVAELCNLPIVINALNRNIPYLTAKLFMLFNEIRDLYGEVDVIHSHYFTTSFAPLVYKYNKKGDVLIAGPIHNEPIL